MKTIPDPELYRKQDQSDLKNMLKLSTRVPNSFSIITLNPGPIICEEMDLLCVF